MQETITSSLAAKLLGVSVETVRQWAIDGTLASTEATSIKGPMRLFDRKDVERLARDRQASAA